MKIIWTAGAADDLEELVLYIRRDSSSAAQRVASVIYEGVLSLATMPMRGRQRESDSSRELIVSGLPYLVVYEVIGEGIFIKAIRHTARLN